MPISSARNKKAKPKEPTAFGHRAKSGDRGDAWMGTQNKMDYGEKKTPLDKGRGISITEVNVHRKADADTHSLSKKAKDHTNNSEEEVFGHRKKSDGHNDDWMSEKQKMELGEKKTALDKGRGVSVESPEDEEINERNKGKKKKEDPEGWAVRRGSGLEEVTGEVGKEGGGCGCVVM
ncbi:hypothetical protein TL16_g04698 [Triparma laevis f. inornata]|uniref:Uncharacterized protein n=2 Tax=Triparma laevis TaxID=1534972 RepID=A0A9W7KX00_9STRA|nr:hypothetical protein TL16_g04698 [Triparma laevis f. inornata]GMI14852.1 hypothetical protein TrLO_g12326 [Triparma laevis f. longispina]